MSPVTRFGRRSFLRVTAVTAGTVAAGPLDALTALARTVELTGEPVAQRARNNAGYGWLRRAGPELDLPEGFSYVRFGATGRTMTDGRPTPPGHDGMAAFPGPRGAVRLVRNHEVPGRGEAFGRRPYDPRAAGGVVNLVFDPGAGKLVAAWPALTGTLNNCAGGATPWGTWVSCEESTRGIDDGFEQPHGYCFEVPHDAESPVRAVPLPALGRFVHEAVCIDPVTGNVYETEDQDTAGFYRFRPKVPGDLAAGGRLQMLGVADRPDYDTRRGQRRGVRLPVVWVDIPDPDPKDAGRNPLSVFQQGLAGGGAVFGRLEGCFWHRGRAIIVSTNGGDANLGQVWKYRPGIGGGSLALAFESPSRDLLRYPDNVTATPRGGLLLCEDGSGPDHLRGLTPDGRIFNFARNRFSDGEFAGATYSPDGRVLFVNVQRPGVTFAITGPWHRGPL